MNSVNRREIRTLVRDEIVRLATVAEPLKKKTFAERLASPLGLWLLSTLVLSLLPFVYSKYDNEQTFARQHRDRIGRIGVELELRLRNIVARLEQIPTEDESQTNTTPSPPIRTPFYQEDAYSHLTMEEAKIVFNKPDPDRINQVEFKDHTVRSLLAEAYFLAQKGNEMDSIYAALLVLDEATEYQQETDMIARGQLPPGSKVVAYLDGVPEILPDDIKQTYHVNTKKELESHLKAFAFDQVKSTYSHNRKAIDRDIINIWHIWLARTSLTAADLHWSFSKGRLTIDTAALHLRGDPRIYISPQDASLHFQKSTN